jgi:hypothetical protein
LFSSPEAWKGYDKCGSEGLCQWTRNMPYVPARSRRLAVCHSHLLLIFVLESVGINAVVNLLGEKADGGE